MKGINSSDFENNMEKCFDLAIKEKGVIQRGRAEAFVLVKEKYLEPDKDLARAISFDDFAEGVRTHIRSLYTQQKK